MGFPEKVIIICLLVALVVSVLMVLWNVHVKHERLQKKGRRVQGEVLLVERAREDRPSRVHYSFCLPDGTELRHAYQSYLDSWDSLHRGDTIDLVYLPEHPEQSMPVLHGVTSVEFVFWLVGGLLVLGLVVFTLRSWDFGPEESTHPPRRPASRDSSHSYR
ncbi:DUF3592 domain-containing protein [Corallococcus sp. bb12-1]|uniref:DUF3592 domain-containing protein n=1 Tax=Corallococcus sp. bb12-1 TaxID=2996784 RepID=UPI00226F3CA4|nr:DUF3592 domain-containing protein [Corallococcus sp. bb12-1]MCY1040591.1 DUF3592 domain-containing protein [Corallococcus sp. bb12-1]